MRAHVEMSPSEKSAFKSLNAEEREAVLDQMLERVREDLEWLMALESARAQPADAAAPAAAAAASSTVEEAQVLAEAEERPASPPAPPTRVRARRPLLPPPVRERTRTLIGTSPIPPRLPASLPSKR